MVDEDFAWRLAQELVKIDSSDPGAYELEIEQHIKDLIEAYIAKLDAPVWTPQRYASSRCSTGAATL